MNFALTDDQAMRRMALVRKAIEAGGFDQAAWTGLADQGTFAMRVADETGGLALGLHDATLAMGRGGRTLGPDSGALADFRDAGTARLAERRGKAASARSGADIRKPA